MRSSAFSSVGRERHSGRKAAREPGRPRRALTAGTSTRDLPASRPRGAEFCCLEADLLQPPGQAETRTVARDARVKHCFRHAGHSSSQNGSTGSVLGWRGAGAQAAIGKDE